MNSYVHKCLKNDTAINSTRRIRRIIDAKYEKANLKNGHGQKNVKKQAQKKAIYF